MVIVLIILTLILILIDAYFQDKLKQYTTDKSVQEGQSILKLRLKTGCFVGALYGIMTYMYFSQKGDFEKINKYEGIAFIVGFLMGLLLQPYFYPQKKH